MQKKNKSRNLISTNCVFVYATPIFPLVEDLGLLSGLFLLTTNRFIWLRRDIAQKGGHLGDWLVFRFHNVSVGWTWRLERDTLKRVKSGCSHQALTKQLERSSWGTAAQRSPGPQDHQTPERTNRMDEGISSRAQSPAGPLNPAQMGDLTVASSSHTHWNVGRGTQKVPAQHWWMGWVWRLRICQQNPWAWACWWETTFKLGMDKWDSQTKFTPN